VDTPVDGSKFESRPPTVRDLVSLCRELNKHQARPVVEVKNVDGVEIPFASAELLWKLKQTGRAKDALDLLFLKELLRK